MGSSTQHANIMVVEDEALVAEDLKAHIEEMGYTVNAIASGGEEALSLLEGIRPDLVMMDIVLAGDIDGIDVAQVIKQLYHIPVVYLTAYTDREKIERAQATEPYGYLVKPFDERELQTTIGMALHKAEVDRQLRDSKRWAHGVLASIADSVITTDAQGQVLYLNSRCEQLTGWRNDSAIGRPLQEVLDLVEPDSKAQLHEAVLRILELGNSHSGIDNSEAELRHRDGDCVPIAFSLKPIEYDDGNQDGVVLAFRDISLQRWALQAMAQSNSELEYRVEERTAALEQALQRAEQASQAKSLFLANMSHELRTPLNPAIGYAELLLADDSLTEQQRERVEEIQDNCTGLLSLINNMLELAQSDTGKLSRQLDLMDPARLLHHLIRPVQAKAERKGLAVLLDLPATTLPPFLGDLARTREVLERLMDNALKFTEQGSITVQLTIEQLDADQFTGRFTIIDTGIGVPDSQKTSIFEVLTQGDESYTRRHQGAGLGLPLCRRLVDIMEGDIGVDDNPGGGSRFWVTLPLVIAKNTDSGGRPNQ